MTPQEARKAAEKAWKLYHQKQALEAKLNAEIAPLGRAYSIAENAAEAARKKMELAHSLLRLKRDDAVAAQREIDGLQIAAQSAETQARDIAAKAAEETTDA